MTREEYIYEASKAYSEYEYDQTNYENGFINGAIWADETMIENACKWLIGQKEMNGISFQEDFIERFKMEMKKYTN